MRRCMKRERRLPVHLSEEEHEQVMEYRWRNRVPSQQEAVRQLIAKGLQAEAKESEAA